MARAFLMVVITLASLSIPPLWARECRQSEGRVYFAKTGYVTSFWDAHDRCVALGGRLAEFSTRSMNPSVRTRWMKNISDTFIIGGLAFGKNNVAVWYSGEELVFQTRLQWGHGEPRIISDHKCTFMSKGLARTGKCHSWEPSSVRALCELSLFERAFRHTKCTLCMCPGQEMPLCMNKRCDLPCVKLREDKDCMMYPCRYKDRWNPPKCEKICNCPLGCDAITGQCQGNCAFGWKNGPNGHSCNQTIYARGYFRYTVLHKLMSTGCVCRGDTWCDRWGGCWSCWPGAGGRFCAESDCPVRRYGRDCEKTCHCADPVKCAQEQGHCLQMPFKGCSGKWLGRSCTETICSTGLFGPDCQYICACKYGEQCDLDSGHCAAGCEDGWMGPSCNDTLCPVGKYGSRCSQDCGDSCKGEACNAKTGRCISSYVKKRHACKDPHKHGYNCDKQCTVNITGLCKGCDRDFGDRCGECKYGYHLSADGECQECPDNTFGFQCLGDCDISCPEKFGCNKFEFECYDMCKETYKTKCNHECSEPCPSGTICDVGGTNRCKAGKCSNVTSVTLCNHPCSDPCPFGTFCDAGKTDHCQVCAKGRFGFNCARLCSHECGPGVDCDVITGQCNTSAQSKHTTIAEQCYPHLIDQTVSKWLPFVTVLPAIFVVCPIILFSFILFFNSENPRIKEGTCFKFKRRKQTEPTQTIT
ncbi:multiple epidermal growth factor-like domains protein 10 [Aplysia californica]|uniref:Multiple epidermal growth factor-like domains protein 10 n=1 Tax=Aplysia californica TaxID=6500 RepID=A0ABM0K305_APLCA|nr:multiple epidermal growth factor-like domains protein 10 [Aplysia californica]